MALPFDVRMIWGKQPREAIWSGRPKTTQADVAVAASNLSGLDLLMIRCRAATVSLLANSAAEQPEADGSLLSKTAIKRAWALAACDRCRKCPAEAIMPRPVDLRA